MNTHDATKKVVRDRQFVTRDEDRFPEGVAGNKALRVSLQEDDSVVLQREWRDANGAWNDEREEILVLDHKEIEFLFEFLKNG